MEAPSHFHRTVRDGQEVYWTRPALRAYLFNIVLIGLGAVGGIVPPSRLGLALSPVWEGLTLLQIGSFGVAALAILRLVLHRLWFRYEVVGGRRLIALSGLPGFKGGKDMPMAGAQFDTQTQRPLLGYALNFGHLAARTGDKDLGFVWRNIARPNATRKWLATLQDGIANPPSQPNKVVETKESARKQSDCVENSPLFQFTVLEQDAIKRLGIIPYPKESYVALFPKLPTTLDRFLWVLSGTALRGCPAESPLSVGERIEANRVLARFTLRPFVLRSNADQVEIHSGIAGTALGSTFTGWFDFYKSDPEPASLANAQGHWCGYLLALGVSLPPGTATSMLLHSPYTELQSALLNSWDRVVSRVQKIERDKWSTKQFQVVRGVVENLQNARVRLIQANEWMDWCDQHYAKDVINAGLVRPVRPSVAVRNVP